jgi:hypothetical protein
VQPIFSPEPNYNAGRILGAILSSPPSGDALRPILRAIPDLRLSPAATCPACPHKNISYETVQFMHQLHPCIMDPWMKNEGT